MLDINDADVAELVDARDLKCLAATEGTGLSCKTPENRPAETVGVPAHLQNKILSNSDTDLTQARSLGVRSRLLVQRRRFGAKTLPGRLCSNIDEALQNRETATGDQLTRLDASIATWAGDLAAASRSLPKGDRA